MKVSPRKAQFRSTSDHTFRGPTPGARTGSLQKRSHLEEEESAARPAVVAAEALVSQPSKLLLRRALSDAISFCVKLLGPCNNPQLAKR